MIFIVSNPKNQGARNFGKGYKGKVAKITTMIWDWLIEVGFEFLIWRLAAWKNLLLI